MTVGRVSTFSLQQSTLRDSALTQERLSQLQIQLSSGLKSQNFKGIASQSEQYLQLEARISRTKLYNENNRIAMTRLDTTDNVLGQTIETVTNLKSLIMQRRNGAVSGNLAFPEQLDGLWRRITTELNTSLEGRYLFSGTRTDVPPVSATVFPSLRVDGVADDGYYAGSSDNITLRADDNLDITYNVRANEPGFQKVFAALAMARKGDQTNSQDDLIKAFNFAEQGLNEIISARAKVNANKVTLDQIVDRQTSLNLYWTGVKEEIVNADLVSVSTQVALNQGILQASFQSFARINSLRLVDFLR
ncbi:MAG: hypothetical protein LW823_06770 [Rickettsiales bacterium]|jgi:flagellar hook-associated protein 3 FlgL|nr:hypothetical protein [Rickettsiales bacterium]